MNLKPRICPVVTGKTIGEFLTNLSLAQKLSDLVELRVDFINGVSAADLSLIKRRLKCRAIFTGRGRPDLIEPADALGFDFIDVELETLEQQPIKLNRSKLIVSFHNFDWTPPLGVLRRLLKRMKMSAPEICKIATMVKSDHDLVVLMRLLLSKKASEKLIVIGMGEKGKISRVLFPLFGSYLTYASIDGLVSAPGQIGFGELQSLYVR